MDLLHRSNCESLESSECLESFSSRQQFAYDIGRHTNDISLSQDKISCDKINENQAQDPPSSDMNDMNDMNGILHNLHIPRNQPDDKEKSDREKLSKNDTDQAPAQPNKGSISRTHPHSDKFQCSDCKVTGDRFAMNEHLCSGSKK